MNARRTIKISDARPTIVCLTDVVDQVIKVSDNKELTMREVVESIGDASFAPLLLLPALALATPLSGIPLFSSLMGIVIFLVSTQMLLRRRQLWFPRWILRRSVSGHLVKKAFKAIYPVARWLDARTDRRFRLLVRRPLVFIPQLLCVISGMLMPMLEIIPFSSSVIGVGVALLALGMLARDGIVILIGVLPYGIVVWLIANASSA